MNSQRGSQKTFEKIHLLVPKHSCAIHAHSAAANIQPFTFHQVPPSQRVGFRGCLHVVKEQNTAITRIREHRWSG